MALTRVLLARTERLTPADHQTHRRYPFGVPDGTTSLRIHVRYEPKLLSAPESAEAVQRTLAAQSADLAARVGDALAERWAAGLQVADVRIANLLTISLDDANGAYRGAGHRHAPDQLLELSGVSASPGLTAGELPPGEWTLTLSAHTLVSAHCDVQLEVEAELT